MRKGATNIFKNKLSLTFACLKEITCDHTDGSWGASVNDDCYITGRDYSILC